VVGVGGGCKPVVTVDGFPVVTLCGNTYWFFTGRFSGDRPIYSPASPVPLGDRLALPTRIVYVAELLQKRYPHIKVYPENDPFYHRTWRKIEASLARREVMRTALKAYKVLRREYPEVPQREILSAVLRAAWADLFEKYTPKTSTVVERARQILARQAATR